MGLILKIQLTNPTVWQSNQYLRKSFLPTPKPSCPLEYRVLLFQTLHKHSWTQHRWTEVEKNSQMSVATTGPVAQLGHKQNVARLIHNKTPVWRWNCFFLHFFATGTCTSTHRVSSLQLITVSTKATTLCCRYPRFSVFMHALCSCLQECIHRSHLSITWTSIIHSCHSRQWKHCHVIKAAPQTHLLQLQMRKAGRWKTLVNQPKAECPLWIISLKIYFFFSCIVAAIFLFCPNETNKTMLQAFLIP